MRRTLLICAVAGTLASTAGCGGGAKDAGGSGATASAPAARASKAGAGADHDVVLEVLGKGKVNGIVYSAGANGSEGTVPLPWKKTERVRDGLLVAVLANGPMGAKVTCRITVDGAVVKEKTGEVAQCRHTLGK